MQLRRSSICLFSDLYDLKKSGVGLDTRLILDDGELAIHWPLLQIWGDHWWTGLGQAGDDNVVLLPGVSVTDAQVFVDSLYGRDIVNNRHFTVTEDTGVVNKEICSDKSDDIKLELVSTESSQSFCWSSELYRYCRFPCGLH